MTAPAVLVMARAPLPGRVKTRLQPAFSPEECAEIQRALVRRTVGWAVDVAGPGAAFVAHHPPQGWGDLRGVVPAGVVPIPQRGDHLGERLSNATSEAFGRMSAATHGDPAGPLIVVGVDTRLRKRHADDALKHLQNGADVVFGPALDGGYYLVAMARPQPALFDLPPEGWGGPGVLRSSIAAAHAAGLKTALLEPERDLDTPADAAVLATEDLELARLLRPRNPLVSVVIPTRDEAQELPHTLDHLAELPGHFEVTVVDGGSHDHTEQIARDHPLRPRVLQLPDQGRAAQLNAGAEASAGDPIVFLHADSRLPHHAYDALTATTAKGGNFAIRFDGPDLFSRTLGAWYRAQRRLGIYYGDSAIWVRRATFEQLGGFREDLSIMDDYDLARRLEKSHETACLPGPVTTSARRWRALGIPRTVLSWVVIRWLFVAGVPSTRLARLYRRVR